MASQNVDKVAQGKQAKSPAVNLFIIIRAYLSVAGMPFEPVSSGQHASTERTKNNGLQAFGPIWQSIEILHQHMMVLSEVKTTRLPLCK